MAAVEPRTLLVGGNWKCNGTTAFVKELAEGMRALDTSGVDVVISPTFIHINVVQSVFKSNDDNKQSDCAINISAQNVSATGNGAFTGEISPAQLIDAGINYTLIGHSERRAYYNETDEVVTKKVVNALNGGLNVIACLGETADERAAEKTKDVIVRQLAAIVAGVTKPEQWKNMVIAYEPVWAIGKNPDGSSRKPCESGEAQNVCKNYVRANLPKDVQDSVRVLYGGSVKPKNAAELIAKADIDGFLVGGASLKSKDFGEIIKCAQDSVKK